MTGCPNREQLASLVAERTEEFDGSEIAVHAQLCPKCRQFLEALSQETTINSVHVHADEPAPSTSMPGPTVETIATWADRDRTVDTQMDGNSRASESPSLAATIGTFTDAPPRCDHHSAEALSEETLDDLHHAPAAYPETQLFAPGESTDNGCAPARTCRRRRRTGLPPRCTR